MEIANIGDVVVLSHLIVVALMWFRVCIKYLANFLTINICATRMIALRLCKALIYYD